LAQTFAYIVATALLMYASGGVGSGLDLLMIAAVAAIIMESGQLAFGGSRYAGADRGDLLRYQHAHHNHVLHTDRPARRLASFNRVACAHARASGQTKRGVCQPSRHRLADLPN
jgi:hypothetical protein